MITACALLGVFSAAGCSGLFASSPEVGCTDRSARLAGRLDDLAVLELRPAAASLREQGSGCDASSGSSHAERVYRFPGTADEVTNFYHDALRAAGWKQWVADGSPNDPHQLAMAGLCFSRPIEGTATLLHVSFRSESGEADRSAPGIRGLALTATANSDHDMRC